MANFANPVDDQLVTLTMGIREVRRLFARDGIDDEERQALQLIEEPRHEIGEYRLRVKACDQFIKTGEVTEYTIRNFRAAGAGIVDLARERRARTKVVPFRRATDEQPGGPEAA